jgi:hypothetical protein
LDSTKLPAAADTVDNAALLQVDIAAIVGVLIFLTISSVVRPHERPPWWILTSLLVTPFAFSAMVILLEDIFASEYIMRVVAYNINIPEASAFLGFLLIFGFFVGVYRTMRKSQKQQQHKPDCQCHNCKDKRKESNKSS